LSRILAVDYGSKRVGLAETDDAQIIATGLTTVATNEVHQFIKQYVSQYNPEAIVVGLPRNMDHSRSEIEPQIKQFVKSLKKLFPNTPIEREDERFTSKMAFQSMLDAGYKKKERQKKGNVDMISATLILQSYLERKGRK